jgi:hypothetical protein
MSKNIKIVDVNDIEEVILSKHEIDLKLLEDKKIDVKMTLQEYFDKYATPSNIYMVHGIQIPFSFHTLYGITYIYVCDSDKDKLTLLLNKLKLMKYDINNLIQLSFQDLLDMGGLDQNDIVIINDKYYK